MEPTVVALVPKKKSRYSKHKIVDCCEACGTTHDLETHHVVPQAVAVPSPVSGNPVIPDSAGTSVHNPSNLRVLCRTCHDKEHHHAPPPRHFQVDA
jgi:5-methylcytosine-specific restriction endonuclease McrA